jgi:phosphoribosylglycinamide formyltransferase 2
LFCTIGHRQERGDYQESWQPAVISDKNLYEAQDMAEKLLKHLVALDFWVEFFLADDGVYFSNYLQDRMIRNGSFGNAKF